jgi:hypothetical protein
VIDNSQRSFTQSAATEELLSRFIQPIPATGARTSERATTAKKPVKKGYRRPLPAKPGKDTRASLFKAIFGPYGFFAMYNTDGDNAIRKRKAQPKAKRIQRNDIKLEWSSPDILPQEPFEPKTLLPPSEQAHRVLNSRFEDAIEPPITFVNDLNDRQLSGKFQFVSSYIRRPGVEAASAGDRSYGCDCIGGCMPDSCSCLIDDIEADDFGGEIDHGKVVPYQRVHTAAGKRMSVLRNEYLKSGNSEGERQEIVECNRSCGCGQDCWNRVVQKGRTLPLEIFMTPKCGFGQSHRSSFFSLSLIRNQAYAPLRTS